ncbi:hypothetical protein DSM107007_07800 [Nostoc sp. PCC 7120 = FACHB-418]|nr:hypothetical protein DSM107007_07800 [Nostoc sp. PCC 7120 = FACHB-418]BAB74636.1 asr2937 [Nostoc sp. PCC 7120 = FACHB-418]
MRKYIPDFFERSGIYRLISNFNHLAPHIANKMSYEGVSLVVPLLRDGDESLKVLCCSSIIFILTDFNQG